MSDKILFLGTAGGVEAVNSQMRASGGIIVKMDGEQIHIDPGPGAILMARNCGVHLNRTTVVLASHEHLSHTSDINSVIAAMTMGGLNTKGTLFCPKSVYDNCLRDYFKKMIKKYSQADVDKTISVDDIKIKTIKTEHTKDSVGFKIYGSNFILGYTGDTKYFSTMYKNFDDCDIVIFNCKCPANSKCDMNLTETDVTKIVKKINPKLVVLNHFGRKFLEENPVYSARNIQRETGIQVIVAEDGMVLDPVAYSANKSQKTLGSF